MNISNLSELIHANMLNEGSVLSVTGFALSLHEFKNGFAFFSNNKKEIIQAVQKGAFAIISEHELCIDDKEMHHVDFLSWSLAVKRTSGTGVFTVVVRNCHCEHLRVVVVNRRVFLLVAG